MQCCDWGDKGKEEESKTEKQQAFPPLAILN